MLYLTNYLDLIAIWENNSNSFKTHFQRSFQAFLLVKVSAVALKEIDLK